MRTRWKGKRVQIKMLDDSVIDVTIVTAYKELGDWVYKVKYPCGEEEHIPKDSILGFYEPKKAPVLRFKRKIRLVK